MTVKALALVLIGACSGTPMMIAVTGEPELGRAAVETWSVLGFTYTDGPADLTIDLRREIFVSDDCSCRVLGAVYDGRVTVDPKLENAELLHTTAHEFGHVLLDAMHLESYIHPTWGNDGIMRASPDATKPPVTEPTADDLALACYTIGVCIAGELVAR